MINPQLDDYIKKQLAKGVAKDAVRAALVGVGWQESAVDEALRGSGGAAAVSSSPSAASSVDSIASSSPAASSAASPTAVSSPFLNTDPAMESAGGTSIGPSPSISAPSAGESDLSPQISSTTTSTTTSTLYASKKSKPIALVIVATLAVIFAVAAGYFWRQNQNLKNAASGGSVAVSDTSGLTNRIASLTNDRDALMRQVSDLTSQVIDLNGQLSAFAVSKPGASEIPISLTGALGGGGKDLYTVLTNEKVLFNIKNSKDSKVSALLKPLLATSVAVSGMHAIGSRDVTVDAVNGSSTNPISTAATSTLSAPPTSAPPTSSSNP